MKYTIVQHSGYGYGGDPTFFRGLEMRAVPTKKLKEKIESKGGLVFDTWEQADRYAMEEMYRNVSGFSLVPIAPGEFLKDLEVDQLRVYVPKEKVLQNYAQESEMQR